MNCAWCGANDNHSDSHGICHDCADEMLLQSAQRQYDKTPSYVETQAALAAKEWDAILSEQMEVVA